MVRRIMNYQVNELIDNFLLSIEDDDFRVIVIDILETINRLVEMKVLTIYMEDDEENLESIILNIISQELLTTGMVISNIKDEIVRYTIDVLKDDGLILDPTEITIRELRDILVAIEKYINGIETLVLQEDSDYEEFIDLVASGSSLTESRLRDIVDDVNEKFMVKIGIAKDEIELIDFNLEWQDYMDKIQPYIEKNKKLLTTKLYKDFILMDPTVVDIPKHFVDALPNIIKVTESMKNDLEATALEITAYCLLLDGNLDDLDFSLLPYVQDSTERLKQLTMTTKDYCSIMEKTYDPYRIS